MAARNRLGNTRAKNLTMQNGNLIVGVQDEGPHIHRINEAGVFSANADYTIIGDGEPTSFTALAFLSYYHMLPLTTALYFSFTHWTASFCLWTRYTSNPSHTQNTVSTITNVFKLKRNQRRLRFALSRESGMGLL